MSTKTNNRRSSKLSLRVMLDTIKTINLSVLGMGEKEGKEQKKYSKK